MKKIYEALEIKLVLLAADDIVRTSLNDNKEPFPEGGVWEE